jgi:ribose transport system substrate-binding protein
MRIRFISRPRAGQSLAVLALLGTAAVAGCASQDSGGAPDAATVEAAKNDPALKAAQQRIEAAMAGTTPWTGPTSGPTAQPDKFIVVVQGDPTNQGENYVTKGVTEAADKIGWNTRLLSGEGTTQGMTSAIDQAIALHPDGIINIGINFSASGDVFQNAADAGIPVVSWEGGPDAGPSTSPPIFYNVTASIEKTAQLAADYVIADSGGTAHVVIFTDNSFSIAQTKADFMKADIEKCANCKVLEYENTPIAEEAKRMPPLVSALMGKYSSDWTYSLAVHDSYFQAMASALGGTGVSPDDAPINVSGGNGSPDAFDRIRSGQYQAGTVANPVGEQGWQTVDEMNRALAGEEPSGYVTEPHLVTADNIGDIKTVYEPDNDYRNHYMDIWGVS